MHYDFKQRHRLSKIPSLTVLFITWLLGAHTVVTSVFIPFRLALLWTRYTGIYSYNLQLTWSLKTRDARRDKKDSGRLYKDTCNKFNITAGEDYYICGFVLVSPV